MADADLFLELAGVAGVFVGFGALIAVRSGGGSDPFELVYTRLVVWIGLLAIVAALAPVTLGPYGLTEHQVWALSSGIVVAVYLGMGVVNVRMPELKADALADRRRQVIDTTMSLLIAVPTLIAVIAIVLGLRPDLEAALYRTIVVMLLIGAGGTPAGARLFAAAPAASAGRRGGDGGHARLERLTIPAAIAGRPGLAVLDASFVGRDLRTYAKAPAFLESRRLYKAYGLVAADVLHGVFDLDTTPRRHLRPSGRSGGPRSRCARCCETASAP